MSVQPLDLQTMYSQMANFAKQVAHVEQGVQLSKAMQQVDVIKQNQEESLKVQQTGEDARSSGINKDGKNGQNFSGRNKKNDDETHEEIPEEQTDKYRIKESYLGQHIDITR